MGNYKVEVEKARKNKDKKKIINSNIEHAQILIEELIKDANKAVYILSDSFQDSFYKKIKQQMLSFLDENENNHIHVITTNDGTHQKTLQDLDFKNNFDYKYININDFPSSYKEDEKVNFLVNDNSSYRFEYSDAHFYDGRVDAVASFNDSTNATLLISKFDDLS